MNIFHCCVQKTASQLIANIFADLRIQEISGFPTYNYEAWFLEQFGPHRLTKSSFPNPLPENTIITPLYIDLETFYSIPKPEKYKAFFVMRDPRDIIVSWYFSMKYSHPVIADIINRIRANLNQLSLQEGLLFSIEALSGAELFSTLKSWHNAPSKDSNIMLTSFEALTGSNRFIAFKELFEHCQIPIAEDRLNEVLKGYSFENLAGRKAGEEDISSHFRKGIEGDWINYFTPEVEQRFQEIVGDLPSDLGYKTRTELTYLYSQKTTAQIRALAQENEQLQINYQQLGTALETAQLQAQQYQNQIGNLQAQQQQLQNQLSQTQAQLAQSQVQEQELQTLSTHQQAQLEQAQVQQQQLQGQLEQTQSKAKQLRAKLAQVRERSQKRQHNLQSKLDQSQATLAAMQSSKFWKLRNHWIRFKQRILLDKRV